jgi:hypothetical protein
VAVNNFGYVVAAEKSSSGSQRSDLVFLNPISGSQVMRVPVELAEIVGLAYHPQSKNLYALDAAPGNEIRGGVFRIDAAGESGRPGTRLTRVATIRRGTAMAFGPDGALYLTATYSPNGASSNRGALLKLDKSFDSASLTSDP